MESNRIFIVTDIAPGGDERNAILVGPRNHGEAFELFRARHPDREPMAVVSQADIENTLSKLKDAVASGGSDAFEVINAA